MQLVKSSSVLHKLLYTLPSFTRLELGSAESLPVAAVLANSPNAAPETSRDPGIDRF